jgi:hypothetical protein
MDFPSDIFGSFEPVSSMFCIKLLIILNLTNTVLSKTTFESIFVSYDVVLFAKEIYRLGPMDLKIYIMQNAAIFEQICETSENLG